MVAFWAAVADPSAKSSSVEDAYGNFQNSGVVPVVDGQAVIRFKDPNNYNIGQKKVESHVHYRWIGKKMMGKVNTVFI